MNPCPYTLAKILHLRGIKPDDRLPPMKPHFRIGEDLFVEYDVANHRDCNKDELVPVFYAEDIGGASKICADNCKKIWGNNPKIWGLRRHQIWDAKNPWEFIQKTMTQ